MKKIVLITLLISATSLVAFVNKDKISSCYLTFKKASNLTALAPEQMPAENDHTRTLNTEKGDVAITIVDGYRVLYNNKKKAAFVNLKVELSQPDNYARDTLNVLDNLSFLNSKSPDMESDKLITLHYNGFNIYGLSRKSIDSGSTLGIFAMFPGNNTIVYFYFNNLKPEVRNFQNSEGYQGLRNQFIGEYTSYINNCKGK